MMHNVFHVKIQNFHLNIFIHTILIFISELVIRMREINLKNLYIFFMRDKLAPITILFFSVINRKYVSKSFRRTDYLIQR